MTFGVHKLVCSEPFLDYRCKLYNCCKHYVATYGKKFIYVHIYIHGSKVVRWIFKKKSFIYLYKVVRTNFAADFCTFHNFYCNF